LPDRRSGTDQQEEPGYVTTNVERYQRIAPVYDLLDLPFETRRYRPLRPLLFDGMAGHLLDAGIGTGRNGEFYPTSRSFPASTPAPRCSLGHASAAPTLAAGDLLYQMDVTALECPIGTFDAAVSSFLFCVLPGECPEAC
jgi:hypothetical protein